MLDGGPVQLLVCKRVAVVRLLTLRRTRDVSRLGSGSTRRRSAASSRGAQAPPPTALRTNASMVEKKELILQLPSIHPPEQQGLFPIIPPGLLAATITAPPSSHPSGQCLRDRRQLWVSRKHERFHDGRSARCFTWLVRRAAGRPHPAGATTFCTVVL